jgi:PAS domain S-box-containing protein
VYFYIPPFNEFAIRDLSGWVRLQTFTGTNVLISVLIHNLYRTQSEVRATEARFRTATDLIPFGVWRADATGNIVELSESFLKAFGCTMTRCAGRGWIELILPEERDRVRSEWNASIRDGDFWDCEYHMRSRDGVTYTVLSRGVAVYVNNHKSWIGLNLDVTEREKTNDQRLAHERDLARFNAELDQFAYVAAHDLQEPLRMIASYLQLLSRRYKDKLDQDAQTFIGYSVEGANRLQALLHGLQVLSVIGKFPDRRKPTPLAEAAERAKANVQRNIDSSGSTVTWGELPVVRCDRIEISQLLENLFDNSLKFTAESKPVHIIVTAAQEHRQWHIVVRDDGMGFDPAYANRIFDLFQRLNPREIYPGTGIGLTICKKIVEVHGGRIWAESEPGQGTAIHFTLPL